MRNLKFSILIVFFLIAFFGFGSSFFEPKADAQSSLAAPTGVTATTNLYNNKIGIYWDTMRGATSYRIFRNTTNNPATATSLATTQVSFFFDTTAAAGQTFFYWVRSENGATVSNFSQSASGVRANAVQQGPVPPLEPPPLGPQGNPTTAAKANLGKVLFWDEQMSSTMTVSCGTCHRAGTGGTDPRSLTTIFNSRNPGFDNIYNTADDVIGSQGVPSNNADGSYNFSANYGLRSQVTGRFANSFINAVYAPVLFWDGRATGTFRDPITNAVVLNNGGALESQAVGPPVNSTEMGHNSANWTEIASRISNAKPLALAHNIPTALQNWIDSRTYPQLFEEAFGTPEVTPTRIAFAIASYERTLFSDQTPLDLANAGIQPLPAAEQRGRNTFNAISCGVCHAGNLLTDNTFRNIGLRPVNEDTGRFQVTGAQNDLGEFRVPSLRNVGLRSSFMHNGRLQTLEEVVAFYNRGGDFPNQPNFPANLIQPRNLNPGQQTDLVAFLRNSLTDNRVRNELPPFDRPRLFTESTNVPIITGTGRAGSGNVVPNPVAVEPPIVGNPSFTVAVSNGLGGASAVLVIDSNDPGVGTTIPASGSLLRQTAILQGSGANNGYASITVPIPNNPALIGQTFFGRWYIADAAAQNGFSVTPAFRFTIFGEANAINNAAFVDFDGDRKTDISIFRPSNGEWWYLKSSNNTNSAFQFGTGSDKIVPADYTGDGKTDIAVWRQSTGEWIILRSEDNSFFAFPFGANGDVPAPGDFDADGKADAAVFRASSGNWFIQQSTNGTINTQFGTNGDVPTTGDYDGDGKADIAIFRPSNGQWWINRSNSGIVAITFGISSDKPVAHDYTGDGKADVAVWRPSDGNWFVLRSEDLSFYAVPFGISSDVPTPGDYDGDSKADTAIFRNGTWYVNRSSSGLQITNFGTNGDFPAPAAFIP